VKRLTIGLALALAPLSAVAGQETHALTDPVVGSILAFYNDPATSRVRGESRIAEGTTVEGDLASLGGPLVIGGRINGDVVVINGDLRLLPGARIVGSLRVVGGRIEGPTDGVAGGTVVYHEPLRFRREGERLVLPPVEAAPWPAAGRETWFGRGDVAARIRGSYNRVEGLPVMVGPRLELGHSNPTVLDARVIYRTRNGLRFRSGDLGHDVRVEQSLGGRQAVRLGVGIHNLVDPIEDAGLSDLENSLSTFILHEDHRDYYTRRGWRGYVQFVGTTRPYDVRIEYRDERHGSIDPGTPWSLLKNQSAWRPQPAVAQGDLRSLRGSFGWDSRNDPADPAAGWLISVDVEQGLDGTLTHADGRAADSEFTSVSVDARRYLRVSPRSRLAVRGRAAGAPDSGPLPPQRQHVLGGEGDLPGFRPFRFDCGARGIAPGDDGFFPYYGCDRALLAQAEFRYALRTDPGISRRLGLDFDLFATPELVLFADAGRAWTEPRGLDGRLEQGPGSMQVDLGAGVRMGALGLYLALPVTGTGRVPNIFVRLGPRI
jgi:outer membrane protein assembly factor BamA